MVNDDGSVRYMDSHIWATVYEEVSHVSHNRPRETGDHSLAVS